jgi:hypothetical protein
VKTLLFAAGLVAACALNAADFRNATWGMSPKQVIKSEKIKLEESKLKKRPLRLRGKTKLLGSNASVIYDFIHDKFIQGRYVIQFINFSNSKKTFQTISKILSQKYGNPKIKEKFIFFDKNNKAKPTLNDFHNGTAKLESVWQRKDLTLKVSLDARENEEAEYDKKAPKVIYILFIDYAIPNPKKVLAQWKQEENLKTAKQAESQL